MDDSAANAGKVSLELNLNDRDVSVEVRADETLLETLRNVFHLTSVRGTCGLGVCGTCTVLLDGRVVSACLTLTVAAAGRDIMTAEGLPAADGELSDVQRSFEACQAYQCSFCIPAMTLTVHAYLNEDPQPTTAKAREYLGGSLCRCGTYPQILEAVASTMRDRHAGGLA